MTPSTFKQYRVAYKPTKGAKAIFDHTWPRIRSRGFLEGVVVYVTPRRCAVKIDSEQFCIPPASPVVLHLKPERLKRIAGAP